MYHIEERYKDCRYSIAGVWNISSVLTTVFCMYPIVSHPAIYLHIFCIIVVISAFSIDVVQYSKRANDGEDDVNPNL